MFKNHVNGCHGNHASFHSANEVIFEKKIPCISKIPMDDVVMVEIKKQQHFDTVNDYH